MDPGLKAPELRIKLQYSKLASGFPRWFSGK